MQNKKETTLENPFAITVVFFLVMGLLEYLSPQIREASHYIAHHLFTDDGCCYTLINNTVKILKY